jgi:hypothetical protein
MIGSNDYGRVTGTPGREDRSVAAVRASAPAVAPMAAPLSICPPNPAGWHTEFTDLYIHGDLYFCGVRWNPTLGSAITVNSTPIYSGSNGRIAFDNAGLFGEAAHITTDGASSLTLGISATPASITLNGVASSSVALLPPLLGNTTFRFPATDGTVGQVLSTDGAGNTSWIASSSGSGTVTSVTLDPSTTGLQVNGAAAPDTITTSGTFVLSGVLATSNGGTGTSAPSNTATGVAILGAGGSLEPIYGGTGTTTTFASGSVIFADASGNYDEDNANLFWADGINQLCLGTNVPVGGPPNIQLNVSKDAFIAGMTVGLGGGQDSTNTAVGSGVLIANTGSDNTGVGSGALQANVAGNNNTAVGSSALIANSGGSFNTSFGAYALTTNASANNNTAVGYAALRLNSSGANNTAVGTGALLTNVSSSGNTAVGSGALNNSTAGNNTAVGSAALNGTTSGTNNAAVGYQAGYSNTIGNQNTAFGAYALYTNDADNNTGLGYQACSANASGTDNTAVGANTLAATSADSANTAVGSNVFNAFNGGSNNTAVGALAAQVLQGGTDNTFIGANASGASNTSVDRNTGVGSRSLENTDNNNNTAVGVESLQTNISNTGGNTAVGYRSLKNCQGSRNTSIGRLAMSFATVTGIENTALGISALGSLNSGSYNTALGKSCGFSITSGSYNTIIGAYDGSAAPIFSSGNNYVVLSDGIGNVPVFWEGLTGNQICNGPVVTQGYTVSGLALITPITGMRVHVTDALAPTFLGILAGGGAINCPAFYDGANWVAG